MKNKKVEMQREREISRHLTLVFGVKREACSCIWLFAFGLQLAACSLPFAFFRFIFTHRIDL
jgi:hypothetical protein